MTIRVGEQGILIPKSMLPGVDEVELRREGNTLVIVPAKSDDPILGLGDEPVACGLPDAAEGHDQHLYGLGR